MAFHVSSEQVDRNVRMLAKITGESITDAVNTAVLERLQRIKPRRADPNYVRDLMDMSDRMAAMLKPDSRTLDELLDYDENGLPR